jgi:hypothetical protein
MVDFIFTRLNPSKRFQRNESKITAEEADRGSRPLLGVADHNAAMEKHPAGYGKICLARGGCQHDSHVPHIRYRRQRPAYYRLPDVIAEVKIGKNGTTRTTFLWLVILTREHARRFNSAV